MKNSSDHTLTLIAAAAALISLTTYFYFLPYGIDPFDEALGYAQAHLFFFGNRPYVDELNLTQGAGILLVPLYAIMRKLNGSVEGLILTMRYVFFTSQLLLGLFAFWRLRRSGLALHTSILCATFVPLLLSVDGSSATPSFSYNSIAGMAFLSGLLFLLPAAGKPKTILECSFAGLAFGFAAVAHPSFLPATFFSYFLFHRYLAKNQGRLLLAFFLASLVPLTLLAYFLAGADWVGIKDYRSLQVSQGGMLKTAARICLVYFSPLLIVYFLRKRWPRVALISAYLLPLVLLPYVLADRSDGFKLTTRHLPSIFVCWGFIGWSLDLRKASRLGDWVYFTLSSAFVAAFLIATASTNNWQTTLNVSIVPMMVSVVLLEAWNRSLIRPFSEKFSVVVIALFLVYLGLCRAVPYKDGPPAALKHRVAEGPYAGMYSGSDLREFLECEARTVKPLAAAGKHLLAMTFIDSANFLFFDSPTRAPSAYSQAHRAPQLYIERLKNPERGSVFLVRPENSRMIPEGLGMKVSQRSVCLEVYEP